MDRIEYSPIPGFYNGNRSGTLRSGLSVIRFACIIVNLTHKSPDRGRINSAIEKCFLHVTPGGIYTDAAFGHQNVNRTPRRADGPDVAVERLKYTPDGRQDNHRKTGALGGIGRAAQRSEYATVGSRD